jgi:KipI family sensor histidine kinase inhibitor
MQFLTVRPLADAAITLDFATSIGFAASARVHSARVCLRQGVAEGHLPGVTEVTSAFCSVTLHYDCLQIPQEAVIRAATDLLENTTVGARPEGRVWELPCCYASTVAPDMEDLAQRLALDPAEIVAQHSGASLVVYALGFLPGLPFMGDLPKALALPRRTEPRTRVPAGSVAIANGLCVVYPWLSPGGWHILGNCPVPLFDSALEVPSLLAAGDTVGFRAIGAQEHADLGAALRAGQMDPSTFLRGAGA